MFLDYIKCLPPFSYYIHIQARTDIQHRNQHSTTYKKLHTLHPSIQHNQTHRTLRHTHHTPHTYTAPALRNNTERARDTYYRSRRHKSWQDDIPTETTRLTPQSIPAYTHRSKNCPVLKNTSIH